MPRRRTRKTAGYQFVQTNYGSRRTDIPIDQRQSLDLKSDRRAHEHYRRGKLPPESIRHRLPAAGEDATAATGQRATAKEHRRP